MEAVEKALEWVAERREREVVELEEALEERLLLSEGPGEGELIRVSLSIAILFRWVRLLTRCSARAFSLDSGVGWRRSSLAVSSSSMS
jgi:hypothetical protein